MRILGIDTALGACSVALLDGERVLGRSYVEMQRGHAEALAPMTETVMRSAGLAFADLTRISVTTGPGTFTGQRVGLAFARALALALKIPAVGVTTLDAMAAQALAEEAAAIGVAVCDAKRGEVYLGARDIRERTLIEAVILPLDRAAARIEMLSPSRQDSIVLAGSGAELLEAAAAQYALANLKVGSVRQPDAAYVARLGARLSEPDAPPKPLYLRAPDAKLPAMPGR